MWTTLVTLILLSYVGAHPTPTPSTDKGSDPAENGEPFFQKTYYYNSQKPQQPLKPQTNLGYNQPDTNSVFYGYARPHGNHFHLNYPPHTNTGTYRDQPPGGATSRFDDYFGNEEQFPEYYYENVDDIDNEVNSEQEEDDANPPENNAIIRDVVHGVSDKENSPELEVKNRDVFWGSYFGIDEETFTETTEKLKRQNDEVDVIVGENVHTSYKKKESKHDYADTGVPHTTTTMATSRPAKSTATTGTVGGLSACKFVGQVMCNVTNGCHYNECVPGKIGLYAVDRTCPNGLATGVQVCQKLEKIMNGPTKVKQRLYVNPCTRLTRDCNTLPTAAPSPEVNNRIELYDTPSPASKDNTKSNWPPYVSEDKYRSSHNTKIQTSTSNPTSSTTTTTAPTTASTTMKHTAPRTDYISLDTSLLSTQPSYVTDSHERIDKKFEFNFSTTRRSEESTPSTTIDTDVFEPMDETQPDIPWYMNTKAPALDRTSTSKIKSTDEPSARTPPWYYENFYGLLDAYHAKKDLNETDDDRYIAHHPEQSRDHIEADIDRINFDVANRAPPETNAAAADSTASPYEIGSYDPLSTKAASGLQQTEKPVNTQTEPQAVQEDSPEESFEYANIEDEYETGYYTGYSYEGYYPDYFYTY